MVINTKQNSASITTAMIAATCKLLSLPVICVTVGHESQLLSRALGPQNVSKVICPSLMLPRPSSDWLSISDNPCKIYEHHDVHALVNNARKKRAVLLMDTNIGDDFDAEALVQSMCLLRSETISIILPVFNEEDVIAGSRVIHSINPEQCMVHLHDFGFAGIKKCGINGDILRQFPIWQSDGLTQEMVHVMTRMNIYSYLPPLPELSKYYDDFADYIETRHRAAVSNLLSHLYLAAKPTSKHIFQSISREFF